MPVSNPPFQGTAADPIHVDPAGTTTQPISVAALPLPAGAATDATLSARLGTLGQTTMSASAPVTIASNQTALAITAAALPLPAGAATEATLATRVAATQLPAALVGGRLDENLGAWLGSTAPTVGSKTSANSIPVVIASDNTVTVVGNKTSNAAVPDGTNIGALPAIATAAAPVLIEGNQVALSELLNGSLRTDNTSWLGSTAPTVGSKTSANSVPVVIASDQAAIAITPPTLTKSTQGATGVSTQDLKDAGRVSKVFQATAVAGVVAETLLTLVMLSDLAAAAGATSYTVTSGKRLRLTGLFVTWRNNTAAAGGVTIRVRAIAVAPAVIGSACIATANATTSLATIGSGGSAFATFPEGFELPAGAGVGVTQQAVTAVVGFDVQLVGYEY